MRGAWASPEEHSWGDPSTPPSEPRKDGRPRQSGEANPSAICLATSLRGQECPRHTWGITQVLTLETRKMRQ